MHDSHSPATMLNKPLWTVGWCRRLTYSRFSAARTSITVFKQHES